MRSTIDMTVTIRAFEKCGISLPIDGSRDECININGLEGYKVYETEIEDISIEV